MKLKGRSKLANLNESESAGSKNYTQNIEVITRNNCATTIFQNSWGENK